MTYFMTAPFLILYLTQEKGFTATTAGIILGTSTIFYAVFGIWFKYLSDYKDNKTLLVISYILWVGAFLGYSISDNFFSFFLSSILSGASMCLSSIERMLIIISSKKQLYFAQRASRIQSYFTMSLAPVIGAVLYNYNHKSIFFIVALLFFFISLYISFTLPKIKIKQASEGKGNFLKDLKDVIKDKYIVYFAIAGIIFVTASASDNLIHPSYFSKLFNKEKAVSIVSFYFFMNGIFLGLFTLIFYFIIRKYNLKLNIAHEYILGIIIYIAGTSLYFLPFSYLTLGIISMMIALADYFTTNRLVFIKSVAPKEKIGIYTGFLALVDAGWFFSPLILGSLLELNIQFYIVGILFFCILSLPFYRLAFTKSYV